MPAYLGRLSHRSTENPEHPSDTGWWRQPHLEERAYLLVDIRRTQRNILHREYKPSLANWSWYQGWTRSETDNLRSGLILKNSPTPFWWRSSTTDGSVGCKRFPTAGRRECLVSSFSGAQADGTAALPPEATRKGFRGNDERTWTGPERWGKALWCHAPHHTRSWPFRLLLWRRSIPLRRRGVRRASCLDVSTDGVQFCNSPEPRYNCRPVITSSLRC